jgi:hypothetical protein
MHAVTNSHKNQYDNYILDIQARLRMTLAM